MKTAPKLKPYQIFDILDPDQIYENKKRDYEKEFFLTNDEKSRIASLVPDEGEIKMWLRLALGVSEDLKNDYRDGEIEFHDMLKIMRNCSLGLSAERRLFFLGTMAEFGLKKKQKVKKRSSGQKKPTTARWLKRLLIEFFDTTKQRYPDIINFHYSSRINENSIYRIITDFIRPLKIGELPAEKTLEKWLGESQNKKFQPYSSSKKRQSRKSKI